MVFDSTARRRAASGGFAREARQKIDQAVVFRRGVVESPKAEDAVASQARSRPKVFSPKSPKKLFLEKAKNRKLFRRKDLQRINISLHCHNKLGFGGFFIARPGKVEIDYRKERG